MLQFLLHYIYFAGIVTFQFNIFYVKTYDLFVIYVLL